MSTVLLISCYELGHQPIGLALPLAFLRRAGIEADALDVAVDPLDEQKITTATFIGISVPMHTALRIGAQVARRVRDLNPDAHICFYGLYATLNAEHLLGTSADSCIGGEYEQPLLETIQRVTSSTTKQRRGVPPDEPTPSPNLERLEATPPIREQLPALDRYAHLDQAGNCRVAGYVEATRGCLHHCTHCPIPPVYDGRFFVTPADVVLADIRAQVADGATHITFGDPDFLNGPTHSLRIVRAMHEEFPELTFDFTAKVEHLLTRDADLEEFAESGCLFAITAVESLSERVLTILDKRHTRSDIVRAIQRLRSAGIAPRPTWVSFTPWTHRDDFTEMLEFVEEHGLIDHIDPVQYSIRLLIPPGSLLVDHPATLPHLGPLDPERFSYRWEHPDPGMDRLQQRIAERVARHADATEPIDAYRTFHEIQQLTGLRPTDPRAGLPPPDRIPAPRLTEAWFC